MSLQKFLSTAIAVHGSKYDYSKVYYTNSITPVTIVCPIHGDFQQLPKVHRKGHGCQKCGGRWADDIAFLRKARSAHGERYDYSQTVFCHSLKRVTIICKIH